MSSDRTVEFIELYKKLESAIRDKYNVPRDVGAIAWLIRNEQGFMGVRDELNYCRDVRNFLQHNERVNGDYAVVPSEGMIQSIKATLRRVEGMPRAIDLCVRTRDIISASLSDRMLPVMRIMSQKVFSHVPILEDGRVKGVFSENTLLSYIIASEAVGVDEQVTFQQVADLLPLDKHASETFAFVPQNMVATEIAQLFQKAYRAPKRLGVVFVTEHGKQSERILGMLTAWDMAAFF